MAKIGRPKIPAAERSSVVIALRLTRDENKTLESAADKAGLSVGKYIRAKLGLRSAK